MRSPSSSIAIAFGSSLSPALRSSRMVSMPAPPSRLAAMRPVGPAPIIATLAWISLCSASSCASLMPSSCRWLHRVPARFARREKRFDQRRHDLIQRVHKEAFPARDDVIACTVGQMLRQPARFALGGERIVRAIDEQDGHGQFADALPDIKIVDDGQHREFVYARPLLNFSKLLLDKMPRERGQVMRDRVMLIMRRDVVDDHAAQQGGG